MMKGKFRNGLKGGSNYIDPSVNGYQFDSPDFGNDHNLINSGRITMDKVPFPVMGEDNLGNRKMMHPNMEYQFPGSQVMETPMTDGYCSECDDEYEELELTDDEAKEYRLGGGVLEELPKAQDGLNLGAGPLKEQNPYLIPEYNQPMDGNIILPDINRPQLEGTNATEYKVSYDTGTPNEIQIPSVVNGQYLGSNALERFNATGERFKTMNDESSYSKFYDEVDRLGLMKKQDGGDYEELELSEEEVRQYRMGGHIVEELPKAQDGLNTERLNFTIEEEEDSNPVLKPSERKKLKTKDYNAEERVRNALYNFDELVYDYGSGNQKDVDMQKMALETHNSKETNESCTAGATNCGRDYLYPLLSKDKKGIKTQIANNINEKGQWFKNSEWSIPSRGRNTDPDYKKNEGVDAWEYRKYVIDNGLGKSIWDSKNAKLKDSRDVSSYYNKVPLGSLIHMGKAGDGNYIEGRNSDGEMYDSHMGEVIGFDSKDGMPLLYDYGKVRRLDNTMYPINSITGINGYDDYTYGNLKTKNIKKKYNLGYLDHENVERKKYKNDYVNAMYADLDKNSDKIGNEYNIDYNSMEGLKKIVIGLAASESNFNELGDENTTVYTNLETNLGDSYLGNEFLKPSIKTITNLFKDEKNESVPSWKIDLMLKEKNPRLKTGSEEWKKQWNELRGKYSSDEVKRDLRSSYGPLKIKDMPKYAEELGYSTDRMYGASYDATEELVNSSTPALVHLSENYVKYKTMYPELTNEEIIDLATVAYRSSNGDNEEFVRNFITNKEGNDLVSKAMEKTKRLARKYTKQ